MRPIQRTLYRVLSGIKDPGVHEAVHKAEDAGIDPLTILAVLMSLLGGGDFSKIIAAILGLLPKSPKKS